MAMGAGPAQQEPNGMAQVPLARIRLNPYQPRDLVRPDQLAELTESVREHGVLQPIVVRPLGGGSYELVAGERRFRAATAAGLREIPAIIREMDDKMSLALSLIENIQREDLNSIEQARGYRRLLDEFGITQGELAREIGKAQSTIANTLRLLALPTAILDSVAQNEITEGHARAILMVESNEGRISLWREVVDRGLTVRETERRAASGKMPPISREIARKVPDKEVARLEESLTLSLGTRVRLAGSSSKGKIEISYYSDEQLEGLIERLQPG
jgi:ParB family chromosome partitioning protein